MIERLYKEYLDLINKEKYSKAFKSVIKKDPAMGDFLKDESRLLDSHYADPNYLQRLSFLFNDKKIKLCECGSALKWRDFYNGNDGYNKTCGNKSCVSKINVESVKNFYKENLGVEHLFQSEGFKERIKEKFTEKYGVDNPWKSKEIIEKIKITNIKKFGETSWLKVEKNRNYISDRVSEKNNRNRLEKIEKKEIPIEIISFSKNECSIKCSVCQETSSFSNSFFNKKISIGANPCLTCNPPLYSESKGENEIFQFICDNYKGKIIKHERTIAGKFEIDIYLPDLKKGFEFDGIWWHSEVFKEKNYNIRKKEAIQKGGITLYNIWEDLWVYKNEIIKSRIKNVLGVSKKIHARKCEIREISVKEEREFLNGNHIQGYTPSKIKIALYLENELVSLMTFGEKRISLGQKSKESEYELLRFCNKLETSVTGGASKLFNFFINKYNPASVLSYQDNAWGAGDLYKNIGFNLIDKGTFPNYWWCKGNVRFHRFNFRKDKLIKEGYDRGKTEDLIMTERGYYKLWDFGNLKWEYTKKA
jgi:hypothetical protein